MTQTSVIVFNIYDNKKYSKKKDSGFLGMASIAMNVDYIPHSSARNTFFKFYYSQHKKKKKKQNNKKQRIIN